MKIFAIIILRMQTQRVGNSTMIVVKNDQCQKMVLTSAMVRAFLTTSMNPEFKSKINGCHQQSLAALFSTLAATNS